MPLNLLTLPAPEAERLAYAEGFTMAAELFARIDALQKALGESIAHAESLECEIRAARFVERYERAFPKGTE